jgi:hypothetical protein
VDKADFDINVFGATRATGAPLDSGGVVFEDYNVERSTNNIERCLGGQSLLAFNSRLSRHVLYPRSALVKEDHDFLTFSLKTPKHLQCCTTLLHCEVADLIPADST